MFYVIDAHPVVWYISQDPRLSAKAMTAMDDRSATLVFPTIALGEIGHLHARGRLPVSLAQVRSLITATTNAVIHPFDAAVLDRVPRGMELHDAIIVATALVYQAGGTEPVKLVTKDRKIVAAGLVDVLW